MKASSSALSKKTEIDLVSGFTSVQGLTLVSWREGESWSTLGEQPGKRKSSVICSYKVREENLLIARDYLLRLRRLKTPAGSYLISAVWVSEREGGEVFLKVLGHSANHSK